MDIFNFILKFFPSFSLEKLGFVTPELQSNSLSLMIWMILILVFIWFGIRVGWQYKEANNAISFYEKHIERLKDNNVNLVAQRRSILQEAKKENKYSAIWEEFDHSLVESNGKLYNTVDAAYFFNTHTLASGLIENRLFVAVPGFLTAIGVLGTFVGLTFGLGEIQLNAGTEKMQQGISAMVGGASTAFLTSLWGVFTSLLFNWYEKGCERKIKERIYHLQTEIDKIFHRIVAEQTLTDIKIINEGVHQHIATLDEKIGDQLQRVMDNTATTISDSIIKSLETALSPALDQVINNSRQGSEKVMESLIQEFLDKIGNAGETQKVAMDNATQALSNSSSQMLSHLTTFVEQLDVKISEVRDGNREMLEKMRGYVSDQINTMQSQTQQQNQQAVEFMKNLARSMLEFNQQNQAMLTSIEKALREKSEEQAAKFAQREEALTASTDKFIAKLTKAIEDLNYNNREMLKVIESHLNQQATEFMQNLATSMLEFNQQNQTMLSAMEKVLTEKSEQQSIQFEQREKSLTDSADKFMEKLAEGIKTLNHNSSEMLKMIAENLNKRIDEQASEDSKRTEHFNRQVEENRQNQQKLTESVNEVLKTQNQQNTELSAQLSALSRSFDEIAKANKESTASMSSVVEKMKSSVAEFTRLSEKTLGDFGTTLERIVMQNNAVVSENRNTATLFNQATQKLDTASSSIGKTAQTLEQTAQRTQLTFEKTQAEFNQFAEALHKHIEQLNDQVSRLLSEYSKQVSAQTIERLNVWNEGTKDFISTASNAMNTLSAVVDEIDGKMSKMRG